MKKKDRGLPPPYAAETRDVRLAGTFEVLVPVPERNKPQRVPLQRESAWAHSLSACCHRCRRRCEPAGF